MYTLGVTEALISASRTLKLIWHRLHDLSDFGGILWNGLTLSTSCWEKERKCLRWQRTFCKKELHEEEKKTFKQKKKNSKRLKLRLFYISVSNAALKIYHKIIDRQLQPKRGGGGVSLDRVAYTNVFSALNKFRSNELICKRRATEK